MMGGFYQAQANIMLPGHNINKGQSITREFYDALPEKIKIKFLFIAEPQTPLGLNQIIGDNDEEKVKRERLSKVKKGK